MLEEIENNESKLGVLKQIIIAIKNEQLQLQDKSNAWTVIRNHLLILSDNQQVEISSILFNYT